MRAGFVPLREAEGGSELLCYRLGKGIYRPEFMPGSAVGWKWRRGCIFHRTYLRSLFKAGTGQTILEYLTDFRLEKACLLLRDKTRKVREISVMTGYDNVPGSASCL